MDAPKRVTVQLVCVHVDEGGTETFEAMFVDDEGNAGSELEIDADGSMRVVGVDQGEG